MDWDLYIQHLISGYIPVIPVLLLYFFVLYIKGKKQTFPHIILSFVFCFYLFGILTMTGVWWLRPFSPVFEWVPFVDMVRGPIQTVLNVLLFIPLGFFLPILYKRFGSIRAIAITGFLISMSVEIIQMFGCGSTDINDLMTNTLGSCIGYGLYLLFSRIIPKTWLKAFQVEGNQCYYELIVFWVLSILIMTTIQMSIFHFLF